MSVTGRPAVSAPSTVSSRSPARTPASSAGPPGRTRATSIRPASVPRTVMPTPTYSPFRALRSPSYSRAVYAADQRSPLRLTSSSASCAPPPSPCGPSSSPSRARGSPPDPRGRGLTGAASPWVTPPHDSVTAPVARTVTKIRVSPAPRRTRCGRCSPSADPFTVRAEPRGANIDGPDMLRSLGHGRASHGRSHARSPRPSSHPGCDGGRPNRPRTPPNRASVRPSNTYGG